MIIGAKGFPSSKTVSIRVYDITDAVEDVAWTSIGVVERANGEGYSVYRYNATLETGHAYQIDFKDNSSPPYTDSILLSEDDTKLNFLDASVASRAVAGDSMVASNMVDISGLATELGVATELDNLNINMKLFNASIKSQLLFEVKKGDTFISPIIFTSSLYGSIIDGVITSAVAYLEFEDSATELIYGVDFTIDRSDFSHVFILLNADVVTNDMINNVINFSIASVTPTLSSISKLSVKIIANKTSDVEATLANATYGLSALQVLLDAIATSTELTAMFDEIKGSGWTDETLKAIKDAIGSGGISEQQVRDAMKLAPTAGDPADGSVDKHLDDILTDIGSIDIGSGTGARQVTVQLYLTGTTTPIASVNIQIWNSTQTVLVASGISDTLGQKVFALNDATYKVRLSKIGSNFTVPETIVVSADSTKTLYGDVINIGTPSSVNTCRVYDYLYNPDDGTIPTTATIYAQIISLPYDYNGKIHAGSRIAGTYNSTTGLIYWDLVYGATVEFTNTTYFGDSSITKVIPALATKRFSEIE